MTISQKSLHIWGPMDPQSLSALVAMRQRKMKTLISAMALHQAKPIEAVAASTSVPV